MKKNILLVRTSTDRQEIDTQKSELKAYAKQFTKGKGELIVIGDKGASAIKEDEQFTYNINRVFEEIEHGDIECVYVWEISRIGRREETLFRFKNELIQHGVNLRVKNPTLQLLNDDGTVNAGCELAFSLFATMAKQEMENKRERFKRGKERNRKEGKYIGGVVLYGYRVSKEGDNKKKFVINEEEAENVRRIYDEYLNGNEGIVKMRERTGLHVNRILTNPHYYGAQNYPPIISKEVFDAALEKRRNHCNQPRNKDKFIDYAHGLIYYADDRTGKKHRMSIMRAKNQYAIQKYSKWVNITMLDSLTVRVLQDVLNKCDFSAFKKSIENRKKEVAKKIDELNHEQEALQQRLERLNEAYYVEGKITNYDKYRSLIDIKMETVEKQLYALQTEKTQLNANKFEIPNLYELNGFQRKEYCQKYIREILYHPTEDIQRKYIQFEFKNLPYFGATVVWNDRHYQYFYDFEPFEWRDVPRIQKEKIEQ